MSQIKVGDIVQLKSGGPDMTVRSIRDGVALCQWSIGKEMQSWDLKLIMLKLIEQAQPAT